MEKLCHKIMENERKAEKWNFHAQKKDTKAKKLND